MVVGTEKQSNGILAAYVIAWLFSRQTFGWSAVASLATWMMTLFITRTQHRYSCRLSAAGTVSACASTDEAHALLFASLDLGLRVRRKLQHNRRLAFA
jgi:hypothetical protein